jgi:hypothetical protein
MSNTIEYWWNWLREAFYPTLPVTTVDMLEPLPANEEGTCPALGVTEGTDSLPPSENIVAPEVAPGGL